MFHTNETVYFPPGPIGGAENTNMVWYSSFMLLSTLFSKYGCCFTYTIIKC